MKEIKTTLHYKLSYVDSISNSIRKNVKELTKTFFKESDINIIFSPFKIADSFSSKRVFVTKRSEFLCIIQVGFCGMQIQLY